MRQSIILLFMLVSYLNTLAKDTSNIRKYYQLVHSASMAVMNGDCESGKKQFEAAFKLVKYPFYIDVNNAIYAELHSNAPDTQRVVSYLEKIKRKGLCVHDFYKRVTSYQPFIAKVKHEEVCGKVIDENIRKQIDVLMLKDQEVRGLHPMIYDDAVMPAIKQTDSLNYIAVRKILTGYVDQDIPLEELIGNPGTIALSVILSHSATWGNYNKPFLDSLCRKGILESRQLAWEYDDNCWSSYNHNKIKSNWRHEYNCENSSIYGGKSVLITGRICFIFVPNKDELTRYNKKREELFLPDLIESSKLKIFAHYKGKERFDYPGIALYPLPENMIKEIEEKNSPNNKLIKYNGKEDFDPNREG